MRLAMHSGTSVELPIFREREVRESQTHLSKDGSNILLDPLPRYHLSCTVSVTLALHIAELMAVFGRERLDRLHLVLSSCNVNAVGRRWLTVGTRDRRTRIVRQVDETGDGRIVDLARQFQVSEMMVRRDPDLLAEVGLVERVRGGAARIHTHGAAEEIRALSPRRPEFHIGVVLPNADYVFRSIIAGIEESLKPAMTRNTLLVSNYSARP